MSAWRAAERGPLAWVALAALLLLAALELGALRLRVERPLAPSDFSPAGGLGWEVPCDVPGSDAEGMESTLEVLEDGRPLGPARCEVDAITARGAGRFRHWARAVLLSTSDGSDPRASGRRYALRHDVTPGGWTALAFALALALNRRRARRLAAWIDAAPPARLAGLAALVGLAFRLAVLVHDGGSSLGPALVKGAPTSDGADWYTLAAEWASGDRTEALWSGWSARRPLYWLLLGALFAWTGASMLAAQLLNVVAGALAAGAIADGVRRLSTPTVGLLAALAHGLLLEDARWALSSLSESTGQALSALALWALAVAVTAPLADPRRAWRFAALGGALFGLANLARTLTLPTLPALAAVVALARGGRGAGPRASAAVAAALLLGVGLALGPWLARQRLVHGLLTVSDNSINALYAATTPRWGAWQPGCEDDVAERELAPRYAAFEAGVRRNLREHGGWYVRRVAAQVAERVVRHGGPPWVVLGAAAAWLLARRRADRRARAAALLLVALALVPSRRLLWVHGLPSIDLTAGLALLGLVAALVTRSPMAIVAGHHGATWGAIALVGLTPDRRFAHTLDWTAAALAAWAAWWGLERLAGRSPPAGDGRPVGPAATRAVVAAALAAGAVLAGGTALALARRHGPAPALSAEAAAEWTARARAAAGDALPPRLAARLRAAAATPEAARRVVLEPGEAPDAAAAYLARPYRREVVALGAASGAPSVLPFDLADLLGREVVVVGVDAQGPDGPTFEVVALGVSGEAAPRLPARALLAAHVAHVAAALGE